MTNANVNDQWATIRPFLTQRPSWCDGMNADRIAAYDMYERIYATQPNAFRLVQRGTESKPIYIPAGKVIVETVHRYMANDLRMIPDPAMGTAGEQNALSIIATSLFRRERFYSMFSSNKRFGIIRGDWLFHIIADDRLPEGSRVSIKPLDPSSYFPIESEESANHTVGCDLVEPVIGDDSRPYIYKLTYRKVNESGPSPITVEESIWEVDKWQDPEAAPLRVVRPPALLPADITQIPVYHIPNKDWSPKGSPFGMSELAGIERLLSAVNQSISDEELALALEGLGVYASDAGTPVNDAGETVAWNLGPARVIELPDGKTFTRVSGVTSVAPYQDHLKYIHEQMDAAVATPAVAKGNVDVDVAESGIALMIQMGPILSRVSEGELIVTDVLTNMFYDLRMWLSAYEGIPMTDATLIPVYGDKIPVNRKQRFTEIMELLASPAPIISAAWARSELAKIGYEFPTDQDIMNQILEEKQALGVATQNIADAMSARLDAELAGITGSGGGNGSVA